MMSNLTTELQEALVQEPKPVDAQANESTRFVDRLRRRLSDRRSRSIERRQEQLLAAMRDLVAAWENWKQAFDRFKEAEPHGWQHENYAASLLEENIAFARLHAAQIRVRQHTLPIKR